MSLIEAEAYNVLCRFGVSSSWSCTDGRRRLQLELVYLEIYPIITGFVVESDRDF
jgi:hypothetical protein